MEYLDRKSIRELREELSRVDREAEPEKAAAISEAMWRKTGGSSEMPGGVDTSTSQRVRKIRFFDLFAGYLCSWGLLLFLFGVAGAFGANTVTFNDQYVHGVGALIVAILMALLSGFVCCGGIYVGYLLFNKLRG